MDKDWKTIQKEWNENADPIDAFDSDYILESESIRPKEKPIIFTKKSCYQKVKPLKEWVNSVKRFQSIMMKIK